MTTAVNVSGSPARRLALFLLFGNYYLAFCIVVLSYETTLKNKTPVTGSSYYLIVFFSVVVYYTHAYISASESAIAANPRSYWYHQNKKLIVATQIGYTILIGCLCASLFTKYQSSFQMPDESEWLLLFIFPVTALLYYGVIFSASYHIRLRTIAWLKPFLIGFVCTGAIVIYPLIFHAIQQGSPFQLSLTNSCYFLTNWAFTTVIAIMFDIKDFSADHNYHLKTFVVAKGLRYTIFSILLPLSVASFVSFLVFAVLINLSWLQILINTLPFLLLIFVSTSFRRRHGILYYLIVIDGLLFLKAIIGIATMTLL